ncbi:MAG: hypothetical protein P8X46_05055 [Nitrospirales bacterium]|jgi:hypothetical protein
MGKKLLKILGIALQIIGVLTLIGVVAVSVMVFPWLRPSGPKINHVTPDKAMFVLNWGQIGDKSKIQRVIHSYESPRSFTGDGIDAYCLQIDHFPEEVLPKDDAGQEVWLKPPIDDALLVEALKTATMMAHSDNLAWFPSAEALNSNRFYLNFWTIVAHNQMVTSVQLIAYDREEQKIYYADAKW